MWLKFLDKLWQWWSSHIVIWKTVSFGPVDANDCCPTVNWQSMINTQQVAGGQRPEMTARRHSACETGIEVQRHTLILEWQTHHHNVTSSHNHSVITSCSVSLLICNSFSRRKFALMTCSSRLLISTSQPEHLTQAQLILLTFFTGNKADVSSEF